LEFAVFIRNNQIHTYLHNNNADLSGVATSQICPRFPNYLGPAAMAIKRSVLMTMFHTARATSSDKDMLFRSILGLYSEFTYLSYPSNMFHKALRTMTTSTSEPI
jgi:hypothetical protein